MAKYKNRKKRIESEKEIDVIEETIDEEELVEEDDEEVEEVDELVEDEETEDFETDEDEEEEYEEIELEDRITNMEKKITAIFYMGIVTLIIVAISYIWLLLN